MVWINVEAHSTVSGLYILVAVMQLCSVSPQPVFQLSEASPSLVLLPWGRKKISSWLSSQLIVANQKACAFSMSHIGTLHSSEQTQALISCLIIFCCHLKHAALTASTAISSKKVLSEINNTSKRLIEPAESLPQHTRSLISFI